MSSLLVVMMRTYVALLVGSTLKIAGIPNEAVLPLPFPAWKRKFCCGLSNILGIAWACI